MMSLPEMMRTDNVDLTRVVVVLQALYPRRSGASSGWSSWTSGETEFNVRFSEWTDLPVCPLPVCGEN